MDIQELHDYQISITKEELALLPVALYSGEVRIIDRVEMVDEALDILHSASIIGFDTETRPSFKKGQTNHVALVQLAVPGICFLFRINRLGLHPGLKEILENEALLKVGVSVHDDFNNLRKTDETFSPKGFVDLQAFVKDYMIADNSLQKIYGILFGERISKGQRLSNWEAPELSPAQQHYAALDALACINIYNYLLSGAFKPTASPYFRKIEKEEIVPTENLDLKNN